MTHSIKTNITKKKKKSLRVCVCICNVTERRRERKKSLGWIRLVGRGTPFTGPMTGSKLLTSACTDISCGVCQCVALVYGFLDCCVILFRPFWLCVWLLFVFLAGGNSLRIFFSLFFSANKLLSRLESRCCCCCYEAVIFRLFSGILSLETGGHVTWPNQWRLVAFRDEDVRYDLSTVLFFFLLRFMFSAIFLLYWLYCFLFFFYWYAL